MSAPRDKGTAAQQPQLLKQLENMLKRPENRLCVDCGATAPRWASTNLGVFMCIRCSGIHRSLGVHISKVKSVSLDKWSPEQVEFMEQMGNEKGNSIYEANVPSTYNKGDIRTENIALEQWIRDKYERKRFMAHNHESGGSRREHREHREHREPETRREPVRPPAREREPEPPRREPAVREPVAPISKPQARSNPGPVKAPAPVTATPAPTATVSVAQSHDLVNWDEPARTPQAPPAVEEKDDFFGEFTVAANGGGGAPMKDKNAILQLYNTPIAPVNTPYTNMHPGMHGPPQPVYPGPNYNVHLAGGYPPYGAYPPNGVYPPNGAYPPNYNMGRGGPMPPYYPPAGGMNGVPGGVGIVGMPPVTNMGPATVPPGYFNRPPQPAPGPTPNYGTGVYPNYGANTTNLANGLNSLRL